MPSKKSSKKLPAKLKPAQSKPINIKKLTSTGPTDENGNPFPMENTKEGGDPICPGGYKIDYDFDPINDPIDPLFRCVSALKDPEDGIKGMIENPAAAAGGDMGGAMNGAMNGAMGGSKKTTRRRCKRRRYISRRQRRKY
jgi:hypothetical protein